MQYFQGIFLASRPTNMFKLFLNASDLRYFVDPEKKTLIDTTNICGCRWYHENSFPVTCQVLMVSQLSQIRSPDRWLTPSLKSGVTSIDEVASELVFKNRVWKIVLVVWSKGPQFYTSGKADGYQSLNTYKTPDFKADGIEACKIIFIKIMQNFIIMIDKMGLKYDNTPSVTETINE